MKSKQSQSINLTLDETLQKAVEALKAGQNQVRPNVLDSLKLDQAIRLAKKKAKEESPEDSKRFYNDILARFPKNKKARDGLKALSGRSNSKQTIVQVLRIE